RRDARRARRRRVSRECGVSLLEVHGVAARHGLLTAVRNLDLTVEVGETGAHRPSEGRIVFDGRDVTRLPAHRRAKLGIALVPEGRRLFPNLTVEENLRVAAAAGRKGRWTVDEVLETFPLLEPLRNRRAASLSGGQQQATAIARSLLTNP